MMTEHCVLVWRTAYMVRLAYRNRQWISGLTKVAYRGPGGTGCSCSVDLTCNVPRGCEPDLSRDAAGSLHL